MAKRPDTWSKRVLIKVIPHDARSIYKLELTYGHLALFTACFIAVFSAFFTEHVIQVRAEEAKVRELQRVNAAQQQQLVNFSNQTNHMWKQLNEIQQEHQEIKRLTTPVRSDTSVRNAATPPRDAASPEPPARPQASVTKASSLATLGDDLPVHGPWWAQAVAWLGVARGGVTFSIEAERLSMLDAGLDRVGSDTRKLRYEAAAVAQARDEAAAARQRMLDAIPSIWPTDGSITSGFGYRTYPDVGFHTGLDIVNYYGAPVYATASGTVTSAGWDGGYGIKIEIDHGNGYQTWYAHNSAALVNVGQFVHKGQLIARLGATGFVTGPHVHYEVHQYGQPISPVPFLSGSVSLALPLQQVAQVR